jgi:hypothetical protein
MSANPITMPVIELMNRPIKDCELVSVIVSAILIPLG